MEADIPTMLPTPKVPASASVTAAKGETLLAGFLSISDLKICQDFGIKKNFNAMQKASPRESKMIQVIEERL